MFINRVRLFLTYVFYRFVKAVLSQWQKKRQKTLPRKTFKLFVHKFAPDTVALIYKCKILIFKNNNDRRRFMTNKAKRGDDITWVICLCWTACIISLPRYYMPPFWCLLQIDKTIYGKVQMIMKKKIFLSGKIHTYVHINDQNI